MQSCTRQAFHYLLGGAALLISAQLAFSHIRIYPNESTLGAREKYTMRVPNEKKVATIRVEGEFPPELTVRFRVQARLENRFQEG